MTGHNIDLVALGINNGCFDPEIQYKAYIDYSFNNSYNKIISSAQCTTYANACTSKCLPVLQRCSATTGANQSCVNADNTCYKAIECPISEPKDFDVYDVRAPSQDPNPPETYRTSLRSASMQKANYWRAGKVPGVSEWAL